MHTRLERIGVFRADITCRFSLPLYLQAVSAGFPNPAEEACLDVWLDLNEHLVAHPSATFYIRASGQSMLGAGIHSGDLLVVDRAREPVDGSVVIAVVDGGLSVKRLRLKDNQVLLVPEHPEYESLTIHPESDLTIWGVVTHVIHAL